MESIMGYSRYSDPWNTDPWLVVDFNPKMKNIRVKMGSFTSPARKITTWIFCFSQTFWDLTGDDVCQSLGNKQTQSGNLTYMGVS